MSGAAPGDDEAVRLLRSMLEIPSVSGDERALAEFLRDRLRGLGFATRIDAVGNLVAVRDCGPGPTLMLVGHMDTVPGGPPAALDGRLLRGRGAVDAKGPLAAMICSAARITDARGRLVVVGAVEEETPGSRGAMEIRRAHQPPDALIVGEPSGWDGVVIGYKGKLDLVYEVCCPAAHSSSPDPKAAECAAAAWRRVLDVLGTGPEAHRGFDRPAATLTGIGGGLEHARAEIGIRTPEGFDTAGFLHEVRAGLGIGELSVVNEVRACRVGRTDPVYRALAGAITAQGARPRARLKTATSDMNTLAEVWNVPMATYGPGDSVLDHSADEHIDLEEYLRSISVLTQALAELAAPSAL